MTFVSTPTAGALMRLAMTDILRSKISDLDPARHRSASRSLMHRDNGGSGQKGPFLLTRSQSNWLSIA
jgi:hypothetical protein